MTDEELLVDEVRRLQKSTADLLARLALRKESTADPAASQRSQEAKAMTDEELNELERRCSLPAFEPAAILLRVRKLVNEVRRLRTATGPHVE